MISYILICYYSLGGIIPKSDFSQIAQLDDLMQHYTLHQEEARRLNQEISFWDFLYIHFILGDEHQHESSQEHENLPLKNLSSSSYLFFLGSLSAQESTNIAFETLFTTFYHHIFGREITFTIFQPPTYFML